MAHRRTAALVTAVLATGTLAAGCGKSDDQKVRDTLKHFEQATEKRDYKTLCNDVLADQLVARLRAIGLPCQLALQRGLGSVLQPGIDIGKVKVRGHTALAQVTSTAVGERPSHDTLRLVKQGDGWRVASLSGAQPPAPPRDVAGHATQ
jgi:hypothetical protein